METQKPLSDLNMSNTSPKSVLDNVDHRGTSSPGVVNSHSHEINETRDAADGIFTESSNGSRHERVEVNEAVDDSPRIYTPMPVGESNSCEGISCKVEKMCTPSPLGENNCNRESVEIKNNANITPQMPPGSPSPDIYTEEPPGRLIHSKVMCVSVLFFTKLVIMTNTELGLNFQKWFIISHVVTFRDRRTRRLAKDY
uniref:Putative ubiquitin carboxyl-terminal hydrolase 21 n=1 Tax=Davidia involucrata TaxID=16924 RepID=A0A5B7CEL0_DAVIN